MTKRLKFVPILIAATAVAAATIGAGPAAAGSQPWCPINHVPWFLPCK